MIEINKAIETPAPTMADAVLETAEVTRNDGEVSVVFPKLQLTELEFAELSDFLTGKRNWNEWPDFETRLKTTHGRW